MKQLVKIIAIIMCISIILTGCMSTNNLNDLTVVQALGIDSVNSQTLVTIQYLDVNKGGATSDDLGGNITANATGISSNISDALSNAAKSLSQKIFMGQNRIIIFGSEYSNLGIDKGLDYLIRSIDSRPDVLVAMSTTSANDIVNNKQNGARIPSQSIYKLLTLGEENGLGAVVSVNDLLNLYEDKTTDVYLPILKSNDDGVSCEGIVCFCDNVLATKLNAYETNGFLFLKNRIKGGTLTIENEEFGFIGVDIVKSHCKCSTSSKDDKVIFECKLDVHILLNELENGSTSDLTEQKIKDIELLTRQRIEDMIYSAFDKCISANSDPFAIGKYLARDNIQAYENKANNWHDNLDNVELKLSTSVKLKNINDNSLKK